MNHLSTKQFKPLLFIVFLITLLKSEVSFAEVFEFEKTAYIGFTYDIALVTFNGKFKIENSFFHLDSSQPQASNFNISIDLPKSSAGFSLATRVMLGESGLNAKKYPTIIFKSREIKYLDKQFEILGNLTIKNITKVSKLVATPIGFEPDTLGEEAELFFHISAEIDRHDFGVRAFPGLVGSKIYLDSNVKIDRVR